jgi:hypothetical protein
VRNLAPDFTAKTYALNDLCTYNGVFYRCKGAYSATSSSAKPDADTTHWEAKKVSEIFLPLTGGTMTGDLTFGNITLSSPANTTDFRISDTEEVYHSDIGTTGIKNNFPNPALESQCLFPASSGTLALLSDIGIPAFSTTASYTDLAPDIVVHDNAVWACNSAHVGAWNANHFTKLFNLAVDSSPTTSSANLMTSGDIKTAVTLNLRGPNKDGFSAWEWQGTPPTYNGESVVLRLEEYPFDGGADIGKVWVAYTESGESCGLVGDPNTRDDDNTRTEVTVSIREVGYHTATRSPLPGYTLGSQSDKSLQPALGFTPENAANKVTSFSNPTDTQYPSAKLVSDELDGKLGPYPF